MATAGNFSLTNMAGAAASITATAGTTQSTNVNTAFGTQLQATVKDAGNNPVSGVTVTFTAPTSGVSGTFAGGVNTVTTNASGMATAPIFTANSIAGGPYNLTASVTGVVTSASFSLTNVAGGPANIVLVQHRSLDAGTTTSAPLAFASANTAGNWIAVSIRGGLSSSQVFTVRDSNGNSYQQASQIGFTSSAVTLAIYYAENIKGGVNTVTVSETVSGPLRFSILEYSGLSMSNSRDVTAAATGLGSSPNSGNMTTTANGDLLLSAIATADPIIYTGGVGYQIQEFVPAEPNTKLIAEDQIQTAAGVASASASLGTSSSWGAVLAAFKAAGGGSGTGPSITSLSQTTGAVGTPITITGTNFGVSIGSSTVTFNGTIATVSNWSATSIIASVPVGATTGPVVATVNGVQSNGVTFTITAPAPSITSLNPASGAVGTSLMISGANFGATRGTSTVMFNGMTATPTSWSATIIVVPVPAGATTGNVVVRAGGVASNGVAFTVLADSTAPVVTITAPANGATVSGTMTLTATATDPDSAVSFAQFLVDGVNRGAQLTAAPYSMSLDTTTLSSGTHILTAVAQDPSGNKGTSAAVTLTVNQPPVTPTITTAPANQTVTAGQPAMFTVAAGGTAPLGYQWQKSGANIAGATSASYTTPATTTSDNGSTFAVVVNNTAGTVTSSAATLTVNPAPVPGIQVSSSTIDFGNDVVGSKSSQVLIITNSGTATLTITQVNQTGSAFSDSGFSLPLNVNAGKLTTITVAFLPTLIGTVSGNISIVSNAPTSPTSVALAGTGIAATLTLSISPTSLSFGNITTGTSSTSQNVSISNTGNASVTISQITLSGSDYTMTGGSAPVTLSPSQNLNLTILFSPTVAGSLNETISIVSNASGSPATVSLSGTGVAPVQHSVALTWNASTSTVAGYNVYRSTVSGNSYTRINSALVASVTYTDSTVQGGTTYYYVTTAVDSGSAESANSNEASATIP